MPNNVIILKQLEEGFSKNGKSVNGIVRLETDFSLTEISASLINLCALDGGNYSLYIFGENSAVYTFQLSSWPSSFRKTVEDLNAIKNGFACSLVAVRADIPVTVAFGKTENFNFSVKDAKKLVAESCLSLRKQNANLIDIPTRQYDDEAVATENYFELEQSIKEKTEQIKELSNDKLPNENGNADCQQQKEKEEDQSRALFTEDEANAFSSQEQDSSPFYLSKRLELEDIFEKHPPFYELLGFFPDSRWAKIYYDKQRYYVVGVIKEDGKEKFICYGVPGEYSPTPPKELKGYCSFIPLSIFSLHGQGFWMMFQDAVSGNCIFPK